MSDLVEIDSVASTIIYEVMRAPKAFLYLAAMAVDADGSPRCYGPGDSGLDYNANGGTPGANWWGGPTTADGYPIEQKVYDPYPGMWVSGTAHFDPAYQEDSPYRYLDSERIPFFVLPANHNNGAQLGDVGVCLNTVSGDNCYAVYGDVGPSDQIGEGSMRLANALGLDPDPKSGGTSEGIIAYLIFPASIGKWQPPSNWFSKANDIFQSWGGLNLLEKLLTNI